MTLNLLILNVRINNVTYSSRAEYSRFNRKDKFQNFVQKTMSLAMHQNWELIGTISGTQVVEVGNRACVLGGDFNFKLPGNKK